MNLLDRLERRFGAWSIDQLPLFIVAAHGVIYLLSTLRGEFLYRVILVPDAVRQGEFWRLFTFLFIPPVWNPFYLAFWLYLLYLYAQALDQEWGSFRFCIFYLIGALATVAASMWVVGESLSNVPLNTSIFLAFATLYPDFELLVFFILPVKIKYLAWLVWFGYLWVLVIGSWVTRVAIGTSLLNYALFFGPGLWEKGKLKWQVLRNRRRLGGD